MHAEQHQLEALAQRVISTIKKLHLDLNNQQLNISCSMGIAVSVPSAHPDSALELLQQADTAMYQSKRSGKNRWQIYDPEGDI